MKKNQKTGLTFSDLENLPCSIRYFKKPITIKIVVPDNRFTLKAKEIKLKIYKKIEYIIGGPNFTEIRSLHT
jgi:hypothetical protein